MNLIGHAREELTRINEDPDMIEGYLDVIQSFSDLGLSGSQAEHMVPILFKLMNLQPLSPLTSDPAEWTLVTDDLWQSKRHPEAFSKNGGATYYILSERDMDPTAFHVSKDPTIMVDVRTNRIVDL